MRILFSPEARLEFDEAERYFGVRFYLEDLLACPIDLVRKEVIRTELKPYIEKDLIHV